MRLFHGGLEIRDSYFVVIHNTVSTFRFRTLDVVNYCRKLHHTYDDILDIQVSCHLMMITHYRCRIRIRNTNAHLI